MEQMTTNESVSVTSALADELRELRRSLHAFRMNAKEARPDMGNEIESMMSRAGQILANVELELRLAK